jgi:hypothetical protein
VSGTRLWIAAEEIGSIAGRIVGPFESMRDVEKWIAAQPPDDFGGEPVEWRIQSLDAPDRDADV